VLATLASIISGRSRGQLVGESGQVVDAPARRRLAEAGARSGQVCVLRFDEPALNLTYAHYRATVPARHADLNAIEAALEGTGTEAPVADTAHRLGSYHGSRS
jgi:hypothetical protein